MQELFAPIRAELVAVEQALRDELHSDAPFVDELLQYGCLLGGKRLRPALLLMTAKAVGTMTADHIKLAAVVEMIHTATLVHDDILDEADMRRHLATVNSRWDNQTSVLLGDYLFTHAFYLSSTLDSTYACRTIGEATNTVCEGELRQVGNRGNFGLTEAEYFRIIGAKTAALCACCCQLGAHYAGADEETVARLSQFGFDLGVAFQIADDVLDLVGDESDTGKSLGTDLEKQKATLPIIHMLSQVSGREKAQMLELLDTESPSTQTRSQLAEWLDRYQSIAYTQQVARDRAERARMALEPLPDSPARNVLEMITHFVVSRSH